VPISMNSWPNEKQALLMEMLLVNLRSDK
jgi:hypothetical protein